MYIRYFVFLFLSLVVFATEEDDRHETSVRFFEIVQEIKIMQVKRDPQSSNSKSNSKSNNKILNKIPFV